MKEIYLVKYYGGENEWEDENYYSKIIFATIDENVAIKYVTKFNNILQRWQSYYGKFGKFERCRGYNSALKNEFFGGVRSRRFYCLMEITKCYYDKIEAR